ncbi:MAG: LAGLIDADG family homing endonuclease [Candidatus Woesearchaeota archaeon]
MKNKYELIRLFSKIKESTNNFRDIRKDIFINFPSSLLIFRHFVGISQKDFSKIIGMGQTHLRDLERGNKRISDKLASKVCIKIINIMDNINKNRIYFGNFYRNYKKFVNLNKLTSKRAKKIRRLRKKYPLKINIEDVINEWKNVLNNPNLARIVGAINGDGHLQLDKDRALASFNSNYFCEIEHINNEFKYLFGAKGIIYKNYKGSNKHKIFFSNKKIALFLLTNGVVVGKKTNKKILVPEWILNGSDKIKSSFLRGLFDAEGYISFSENRWRMGIVQCKDIPLKENGNDYMNQIKSLVEYFGISCSNVCCYLNSTIRKDGSRTLAFKFTFERKYFKEFYKSIGFDHPVKREKLLKAIS